MTLLSILLPLSLVVTWMAGRARNKLVKKLPRVCRKKIGNL